MSDAKEGNGKSSLPKMLLAIIITAIVSVGFSSLVQLGQDRQRISTTEEKLNDHMRVAEGKITELDALKMNQAVMAARLASIDETLKDIRDEMKALQKRKNSE